MHVPVHVMGISRYGPHGVGSSLNSIDLPAGLTLIGDEAFIDCSGLTTVAVPENVTAIGQLAFAQCVRLANLTLPEGLTSIGQEGFLGCVGLKTIDIPHTVTHVGARAFEQCGCQNSSIWGAGTKVCNCTACMDDSYTR